MANQLISLSILPLLVAGILPPLVWLWFWLKEDKTRPEPRSLLVLSFFAGALSILIVIPLQYAAKDIFASGLILLLAWAGIEEVAKYLVAYFIDFRKRNYDEPIDSMIYLITVALGFAAFENVLFLIKSAEGGLSLGITTALMRFIGATLLHAFSSAFLGGIIALAFCKSAKSKLLYTLLGLITATVLHTIFNFFIMNYGFFGGNINILSVFGTLWIGVIALLLFFEKIKAVTCKV